MVKTKLGKRISFLRQAAGLTQEKLAEKTEYSVEFISMVERGINAPSVEGCERIARAVNVSLKELFDFDAEPNSGHNYERTHKKAVGD